MVDEHDARNPSADKPQGRKALTPEALAARREYHRLYNLKNSEKLKEYYRRDQEKHGDKRRAAAREAMRKRREEDPGYAMEIVKRYREKNPEAVKASQKKYAEKNKEKASEKSRAWRLANLDRARAREEQRKLEDPERNAKYYAQNKQRMQERATQWRKDNPLKAREINNKNQQRRRAELALSPEHYTLEEIKALRAKAGKRCAYCETRGRMSIDHIIPLSKGGSNAITNIHFVCKPCNSKKQDTDPIEFAKKQGLLL